MVQFEQRTPISEFYHDLTRGLVPGASPIAKFGRNKAIEPGISEAVWSAGGQWVNPLTGVLVNVLSSNAEDTGVLVSSGTCTNSILVAGVLIDATATFVADGVLVGDVVLNDSTGEFAYVTSIDSETQLSFYNFNGTTFIAECVYRIARTDGTGCGVVHITQAIDGSWDRHEINEFVILNGLTPVSTVKQYLRLTRARCIHAGSPASPFNDGNINLNSSVAPFLPLAQIPENTGQTQMACFSVANNEEAYLIYVYDSINRASVSQDAKGQVALGTQAGFTTAPIHIIQTVGMHDQGANPYGRPMNMQDRIPPRTDVVMVANEVTQTGTDVSAGFELALYKMG